jgi:mRNA-degrading endonuclease RelE of RelBE toxin-antitoxin system
MNFLLADTFRSSLSKLSAPEQKQVKQAAFDLQMDPTGTGLSMHRLDAVKDKNFWSARVTADLRIILHRTDGSLLLCHVDHHDDAYRWAERRRIEKHPTTGAAQIVVLRETVQEVRRPVAEAADPLQAATRPFAAMTDAALLGFGVPPDWLTAVREADEDTLLAFLSDLPEEAAEALLNIAAGQSPPVPEPEEPGAPPTDDPFHHPDARRRFRPMPGADELRQALEFPWEKWVVFLHPSQRKSALKAYSGPARVTGGAGTGKTVVALHRAAHLAERKQGKVLLLTHTKTLAAELARKVTMLRPEGDIEVIHTTKAAYDLFEVLTKRKAQLAPSSFVDKALEHAWRDIGCSIPLKVVRSEWESVVDARNLLTWEAYRDFRRTGRGTPLGGKDRKTLWTVFERVRRKLGDGYQTWDGLMATVADRLNERPIKPYRHVLVDEAQDLGFAGLRFVRALVAPAPDDLFLVGDGGQSIYTAPFSWLSAGVDVRGRSGKLKVNYRTSHQIRKFADHLLPGAVIDGDGDAEDRNAVSMFEGPDPEFRACPDEETEIAAVADWLARLIAEGYQPSEIGIFVRSSSLFSRARKAIAKAGLSGRELTDAESTLEGSVSFGTMHRAKGLEFRAVAVMGCDHDRLPHHEALSAAADDVEMSAAIERERHLFYVACTRARDRLSVTCAGLPSSFLESAAGSGLS